MVNDELREWDDGCEIFHLFLSSYLKVSHPSFSILFYSPILYFLKSSLTHSVFIVARDQCSNPNWMCLWISSWGVGGNHLLMVMADLFMGWLFLSSHHPTNYYVYLNIGDVFGTFRGGYEEEEERRGRERSQVWGDVGVGGGRRGLLFLLRRWGRRWWWWCLYK